MRLDYKDHFGNKKFGTYKLLVLTCGGFTLILISRVNMILFPYL